MQEMKPIVQFEIWQDEQSSKVFINALYQDGTYVSLIAFPSREDFLGFAKFLVSAMGLTEIPTAFTNAFKEDG